MISTRAFCLLVTLLSVSGQALEPLDLGPFSTISEVGELSRKTLVTFDRSSGIYFVSAAGENIWGEKDAFGFVWRELQGEASIGARVHLMGKSSQAHRKAGVMFRQSLAPDSVYVDAVVHGDGLTSLQYRAETGGPTREIQCDRQEPTAMRLEKRGDYFQLFTSNEDGVFSSTGCLIKITLGPKFLAGLVVSAHDNNAFETARFSSVTVGLPPERKSSTVSAIEIVPVASLDRRVVWYSSQKLEVPSFTASGDAVCFREGGQIKKLSLIGNSEPVLVGADNMDVCATGAPLIASTQRLSSRVSGGRSLVWLEHGDGKPRKLINDARNQWNPRIAPDSTSFVYFSGVARPDDGKPPLADYLLLQRPLADGDERVLAHFYGGPGSLGLSPWSPDGKRIVFMSREPDPVEK
jgi:hypothetical protein